MKNEFHLQILRYLTNQIHAVKSRFDVKIIVKFCVFALAPDAQIMIVQNCSPGLWADMTSASMGTLGHWRRARRCCGLSFLTAAGRCLNAAALFVYIARL